MPLTKDTAARAVRAGGIPHPKRPGALLTKIADDHSLYLWTRDSKGYWIYCYRGTDGKMKTKCLGTLAKYSPQRARIERDAFVHRLRNGTAPAPASDPTPRPAPSKSADEGFRDLPPDDEAPSTFRRDSFGWWVDQYLARQPGKKVWAADTVGRRTRWLKVLAAPLATLPVSSITREQVAKVIQPNGQWDGVRERARLVIEGVFTLADVAKNPAGLKRLKGLGLRARPKDRAEKRQPSMPWQHVPEFMASLDESPAARALKLLILTGVRKGDVFNAKWEQFNLSDRYLRDSKPVPNGKHLETDIHPWSWNIPSTKNDRPHSVPLTQVACDALGKPGTGRVFAVNKHHFERLCKGQLSDQPGRDAVPHGFRATIKQWMIDHGVSREVSEAVIEHKFKGAAEAAYDRLNRFDQRIPVMNDWASYASGH